MHQPSPIRPKATFERIEHNLYRVFLDGELHSYLIYVPMGHEWPWEPMDTTTWWLLPPEWDNDRNDITLRSIVCPQDRRMAKRAAKECVEAEGFNFWPEMRTLPRRELPPRP